VIAKAGSAFAFCRQAMKRMVGGADKMPTMTKQVIFAQNQGLHQVVFTGIGGDLPRHFADRRAMVRANHERGFATLVIQRRVHGGDDVGDVDEGTPLVSIAPDGQFAVGRVAEAGDFGLDQRLVRPDARLQLRSRSAAVD
jgi:hypothetical protein